VGESSEGSRREKEDLTRFRLKDLTEIGGSSLRLDQVHPEFRQRAFPLDYDGPYVPDCRRIRAAPWGPRVEVRE
jgi:hypothetical protein